MEGVNVWLGVLVNVVTVLAALGGCGAWIIRSLDRRFDARTGGKIGEFEARLNQRIDGVETSLTARIDGVEAKLGQRIDGVEAKLDGLREVTDVRLKALESDMTIIKQHLLGHPSAA